MATELERAAEMGAERAIEKMMLLLGVDVHSSADLNTLRSDLLHARRIRMASEKMGGLAVLIIIGALVGGALGFIWAGFQAAIRGHG
jgi:hypothetical protein